MHYEEYQQNTMRACILSAFKLCDDVFTTEELQRLGPELATQIAVAMFNLRCKHSHYYETEIKTEFKDAEKK